MSTRKQRQQSGASIAGHAGRTSNSVPPESSRRRPSKHDSDNQRPLSSYTSVHTSAAQTHDNNTGTPRPGTQDEVYFESILRGVHTNIHSVWKSLNDALWTGECFNRSARTPLIENCLDQMRLLEGTLESIMWTAPDSAEATMPGPSKVRMSPPVRGPEARNPFPSPLTGYTTPRHNSLPHLAAAVPRVTKTTWGKRSIITPAQLSPSTPQMAAAPPSATDGGNSPRQSSPKRKRELEPIAGPSGAMPRRIRKTKIPREDNKPLKEASTLPEDCQIDMSRDIQDLDDLWREYREGILADPKKPDGPYLKRPIKWVEAKYGAKWRDAPAARQFYCRRKWIWIEIEEMVQKKLEDKLRRGRISPEDLGEESEIRKRLEQKAIAWVKAAYGEASQISLHALGDMLGRARKANQEPKPKEKKIRQTVNSTRKRIPIVESEQKVLKLWMKDRQTQAVGPNAAAIDSSSPPERMPSPSTDAQPRGTLADGSQRMTSISISSLLNSGPDVVQEILPPVLPPENLWRYTNAPTPRSSYHEPSHLMSPSGSESFRAPRSASPVASSSRTRMAYGDPFPWAWTHEDPYLDEPPSRVFWGPPESNIRGSDSVTGKGKGKGKARAWEL